MSRQVVETYLFEKRMVQQCICTWPVYEKNREVLHQHVKDAEIGERPEISPSEYI